MNKNELKETLVSAGVRPNRKLGQNFLIDPNFLDWIAQESGAAPGEKIIEVGPGFGALTERMLNAGANVTAVEFDHRIADWLRQNLCPRGLILVEGDACKTDFDQISGGEEYRFVSNLPYSAGTVIVANFLEAEHPPKEMLIMLQKEVAERLAARNGDPEYGALSVRTAASYTAKYLRTAPPEMFHPRPEVDSAVIRLTRRENIPDRAFRLHLSRLVRMAFAQRRKKMLRQLESLFDKEKLHAAAEALAIPPDARPEHVSPEQFMGLARALNF